MLARRISLIEASVSGVPVPVRTATSSPAPAARPIRHVMAVVADHGDLAGMQARGGAERQRHAGAWLHAMAGIVAGREIEHGGEAEMARRRRNGRRAVAGGDPERQPALLQPREQGREVADGDHAGHGGLKQRVELRRQRGHAAPAAGAPPACSQFACVARRQQRIGGGPPAGRVGPGGDQAARGQSGVSPGRQHRCVAIDRRPARVIVEQRAVLVEEQAPDRRGHRQPTGITSTAMPIFCDPGPISTPSSGETSA